VDSYFRNLPKQRKLDGLLIISLYPNDDMPQVSRTAGIPVVLVDAYHPQLPRWSLKQISEGAYQQSSVDRVWSSPHWFHNGINEGDFSLTLAMIDPLDYIVLWMRQGTCDTDLYLLPNGIAREADKSSFATADPSRSPNGNLHRQPISGRGVLEAPDL